MVAVEYALAALVAAAVSSGLLWQRHRRGPFGGLKATLWWGGIMTMDGTVAALCLAGAFGVQAAALEGTSGAIRAAAIGLLGPLGLRSPVGKRRIRGRIENVGPTYIYDVARVTMEQELYERMTRLRRADRVERTAALDKSGWDSQSLANRLEEHFDQMADDHARDPRDIQSLRKRVDLALTPPDEMSKMKALVDLAVKEHFWAVLEECAERPPNESEQRPRQQKKPRR
jgi:hypothetical protein